MNLVSVIKPVKKGRVADKLQSRYSVDRQYCRE